MLSLRLTAEVEGRLDNLAQKTGRTKSYYARKAIESQLQDFEDLYQAEKAYGEYVAGKVKSRPIEELAAEYDL